MGVHIRSLGIRGGTLEFPPARIYLLKPLPIHFVLFEELLRLIEISDVRGGRSRRKRCRGRGAESPERRGGRRGRSQA